MERGQMTDWTDAQRDRMLDQQDRCIDLREREVAATEKAVAGLEEIKARLAFQERRLGILETARLHHGGTDSPEAHGVDPQHEAALADQGG